MTTRTIAREPGTWLLMVAIVLAPRLAHAQPADAAPAVSVGAGLGLAVPLHGDFDFTPWAWDADVRIRMAPHVLFEVATGEWRHSAIRVEENLPATGGVIGLLEQTTMRTQRFVQANVLATGARGRVRVTGGGGVGVMQHVRQTNTTLNACSGVVQCGDFASTSSNATGTAQAVGSVEVRIWRDLSLYGQTRFLVPLRDPGSSDLRMTAGVRVGFGR